MKLRPDSYVIKYPKNQDKIFYALNQRVLHMHDYAHLTGYPGKKKLYQSISKDKYWPTLAVDCYWTVTQCPTCARNCIQLVVHGQPFPVLAPLCSVAIDVQGELIESNHGNQYLRIISNKFPKIPNRLHWDKYWHSRKPMNLKTRGCLASDFRKARRQLRKVLNRSVFSRCLSYIEYQEFISN